MTDMRFADRSEAGQRLAAELDHYQGRDDVIVYGLPRGGVPVAYEVARFLGTPLDVLVVRKLGVPGRPELAMGAVASNGVITLDDEVVRRLRIEQSDIDRVAETERREVEERWRRFAVDGETMSAQGRTAIVVDDGMATGSTMRAALLALREQSPQTIVVAVPVASPSACARIEGHVDESLCLATPQPFGAVGVWYDDFRQVTDAEVEELLAEFRVRS